jgi:aarF domain-containing kinase
LYWSVDYIQKHLIQETDFINEANNAQSCKLFFQSVPALANSTHVPEVYWPLVTKRVLTCEWIEGISLSNVSKNNNYPFKIPQIMKTVVDIFANQIFVSGLVHCDPHPGNIIIRSDPVSKNPQVVVIDHGLYIQCSQSFKHDYALFWKSLFTLDSSTLDAIGSHWGMRDISFFASATLARPWKRGKLLHVNDKLVMKKSDFELQVETKQKLRQFLENSDKLPRELLFVGRNLK